MADAFSRPKRLGKFEAEIVRETIPGTRKPASIRRDTRILFDIVPDQGLLDSEHGITVEILISIHEQVRDQRFVPLGGDEEVQMRRRYG